MSRSQTGDWYAVRRTADIIETGPIEKFDAVRITAMLTTDTNLQIRTGSAAFFYCRNDHLTDAVDIKIERRSPFIKPIVVPGVENGQQAAADLFIGTIRVSILGAGTPLVVLGPAELELRPFRAYLVYAVGTPESGTFQLLVKNVLTRMGGRSHDDDSSDDVWRRGGVKIGSTDEDRGFQTYRYR